jgi:TPR repeat protein
VTSKVTQPRQNLIKPEILQPDSCFHLTPIHTIVDDLEGIPENKTMKLLISTFFTLLLGFAGNSYGQDFEETKLLAEQGDAYAQYMLGGMYKYGDGIPENYAEAFKWFQLAAEQGLAEGQNNLGLMYAKGEGVPEDVAEAVKWYRLAAEQGDVIAQSGLGYRYDIGDGVRENDVEAVKWYRLAAEQGDVISQMNLGTMYYDGDGIPQNTVKAYVWYSVAAAQGNEDAKNNRDIVSEQLTRDQKARGQEIAAKCFESDYQDCD